MIVADTNLIANFYVTGQGTAHAEAVCRRDAVWVAPSRWRSELRNVLVGLVRLRRLPVDAAWRIAGEAERSMAGHEYAVASHDVLDLAVASGCTAYDCEFVAVAVTLGVRLVTDDTRVLKAFPLVAIAPAAFVR